MTVKTNKLIVTNNVATESDVEILSSGAGNLDINKVLKLSSSSAYTANGSGSAFLTEGSQLAPNGISATGSNIAKWLTVQDSTGSTLYVPAWM